MGAGVEVSELLTKPRLQPCAEPSSDADLRPISEHRHVVGVHILAEFRDDVDVDDGGAVDANEPPGIERVVERAEQGPVLVGRSVARVQLHIHPVGLDPGDLLDRQQPHPIRASNHQAIDGPAG
jgi:hypothetical protein